MFTDFKDLAIKIEKENDVLKDDIKYLYYVNKELREKLVIADEKIKKLENKQQVMCDENIFELEKMLKEKKMMSKFDIRKHFGLSKAKFTTFLVTATF